MSRRWALRTKHLIGVVFSNGGVMQFDDWCLSPKSARPPGWVAVLGHDTSEVQNGRQTSREVVRSNVPVALAERVDSLPEVFQTHNKHKHKTEWCGWTLARCWEYTAVEPYAVASNGGSGNHIMLGEPPRVGVHSLVLSLSSISLSRHSEEVQVAGWRRTEIFASFTSQEVCLLNTSI